jgi:hypothetical protein
VTGVLRDDPRQPDFGVFVLFAVYITFCGYWLAASPERLPGLDGLFAAGDADVFRRAGSRLPMINLRGWLVLVIGLASFVAVFCWQHL